MTTEELIAACERDLVTREEHLRDYCKRHGLIG